MSSRGVASPPVRPLKRSASTASLPTPPRTQRRRRRNTRSKRDASSEEDSDAGGKGRRAFLGLDVEETENPRSSKRRRLSNVDDDEDQDAFWAGVGEQASASKTRMSQNSSSRSLSEPEMGSTFDDGNSDSDTSFLSRRRMKQATTTGSAPVSPPPSHRRPRAAKVVSIKNSIKSSRAGAGDSLPTVVEEDSSPGPGAETKSTANDSPATLTSSPPTTPKTPKAQIRSGISPPALRHSPDNPFLSSPDSPGASSATVERPVVKGNVFEEKPTIDMVFRGVKRSMLNPHYNHKTGRAKSPDPRSLLPPEHPDFSPDTRGRPRVLWPKKVKNPRPDEIEEPTTPTKAKGRIAAAALLKTPPMTVKRTGGKVAKQALIDSDDEEDQGLDPDAVLPVRPFRLFTEKSS